MRAITLSIERVPRSRVCVTSSMRAEMPSSRLMERSSSGAFAVFSRPAEDFLRLVVSASSSRRCSVTAAERSTSSLCSWTVLPCTLVMVSSASTRCTRASTSSALFESPSRSASPDLVRPCRTSPYFTNVVALPGITTAFIPPSGPADDSSTCESVGTLNSPSISSAILTPSGEISKPMMRPMLTPRICTGSPLRIPPASCTFVLTM